MAEFLVDVLDGEETVHHTSLVTAESSGTRSPEGRKDERPTSDPGVRGSLTVAPFKPDLTGVSETMLWALHNRASEAVWDDGVLVDPDSVTIHKAIDYDFVGHFGIPAGSLAARAAEIDRQLRNWLERHPDGFVVSLGEGLETQVRRVDNGHMRWLSVDLPEAMRIREQFLTPTDRFRHIAVSALDTAWMDEVDTSSGVFIVAQGLLMYLEPNLVRELLTGIADRFPGAEILFDVVPRWFSMLTLQGLYQTPRYRLPPMPWGINRDELQPTLRGWDQRLATVRMLHYSAPRGLPLLLAQLVEFTPVARHEMTALVRITVPHWSAQVPATSSPTHMENNQMTTENAQIGGPMADLMAAVARNAGVGSEIAIASSHVIAKRMTLGLAAARHPSTADHAEFGMMIPEKVKAFSSANAIMIEQSARASQRVAELASTEMSTTVHAAMAMAKCATPMAFARAQNSFMRGWFDRAASNFFDMGMMALGAQDAAMAPIRATVVGNAERLGR